MRHLRCVCFVRPSAQSVQHLIDEFRDPKYGEYFICKKKVKSPWCIELRIRKTSATLYKNHLLRDLPKRTIMK